MPVQTVLFQCDQGAKQIRDAHFLSETLSKNFPAIMELM